MIEIIKFLKEKINGLNDLKKISYSLIERYFPALFQTFMPETPFGTFSHRC